MSLVLWILQVVLAAMFAMAGFSKLTQPRQKLAWRLPWVEGFSPATAALIGTLELAAALALILPASTGIIPALTPLAATGLVVLMVLAATTHAPQGARRDRRGRRTSDPGERGRPGALRPIPLLSTISAASHPHLTKE